MASKKSLVITLHNSTPAIQATLILPRNLLAELKLQVGQVITLNFGTREYPVRIFAGERAVDSNVTPIAISRDAERVLRCPLGRPFYLYKEQQSLRIGPVIGILANIKLRNQAPTGMQEPVFVKLLEAAEQEQVMAYVFSPRDVNFAEGIVSGHTWSKTKGWQTRQLPLPDVVYDQIVSRKFADSKEVNEFRERLLKIKIVPYFNPVFFDKWQVHEWLQSDASVRDFLPDTQRYETTELAAQFLTPYRSVYVKPVNGSLGIGIIRIERHLNGKYHYQLKAKDKIIKEGYGQSAREVLISLQKRLKQGNYVIQRGLELFTYQGRPFDIRILLQKDKFGRWRRTKAVCRIAQSGDITSNLSTGGDALSVTKTLQEAVRNSPLIKKIQANLTRLTRTVPAALEKNSGLLLGELGLDVGVDVAGNVWLIEVNARPWKKPTTEQGSMELVNQSFARPIQFAKYLSGL